jgi:hypothetical protein
MRFVSGFFALALLSLASASSLQAQQRTTPTVPAHGVVGIGEAQLSPDFWLAQLRQPDALVMDSPSIEAQNARLLREDKSMHDLHTVPALLAGADIRRDIEALSRPPDKALYDVDGKRVPAEVLNSIFRDLALDSIAEQTPASFGMVLRRTALRAFPTDLRVFSTQGNTDIDRFQESALFPATPVVVAHRSGDGRWWWVISPRYKAWVRDEDIALGSRDAVLGYGNGVPHRVITAGKAWTVFTREQPQLSELQLEMGLRIPLAAIPADSVVNGQLSYTSWALRLPVRGPDGGLDFAPALLQKNQDSAASYLPLTQANLIRQSFKFLGERYGWGHSYNARDCSGFVSEVYRSMGVELPRNTRDQSISPVLNHVLFDKDEGPERRRAAVDTLQVGDLIYIPGHVMMMIGRIDGAPYVIHDTNGGSYLGPDGKLRSMHLNGVSVTPLLPLQFNETQTYVDRITSIVRIRP